MCDCQLFVLFKLLSVYLSLIKLEIYIIIFSFIILGTMKYFAIRLRIKCRAWCGCTALRTTLPILHIIFLLATFYSHRCIINIHHSYEMNTNKHIYIIVIVCLYVCLHVSSVTKSLSACYSALVISDAFVHIRDFLEV